MEASANKAERAAIAETLQGKVAGMHKPTALTVTKENKGQGKNKRKKDCERICQRKKTTSFSIQELTEEEIEKKNFDKDLQSCLEMFIARRVFTSLQLQLAAHG